MSNIFEFNGYRPVVHESAFVHPNATVTGNVIIGKDVYIGPGAADSVINFCNQSRAERF